MSAIDLYTWPTPNGHKVHIMRRKRASNMTSSRSISAGASSSRPISLKISPNNKMPAMVDPEGPGGKPFALAESGAMLIYLAEKTGRFLSTDPAERYRTLQWLMTQMGHVGPMLGQINHFRNYAVEKIPYAINRYVNEGTRLYNVLDGRLAESEWLGGADYSIADMATYPWLRSWENQGQNLEAHPNLARWFKEIEARARRLRADARCWPTAAGRAR